MRQVEAGADGVVTIRPGTLLGALSTLERERLIEMLRKEGRRKAHRLVEEGEAVFQCRIERLQEMTRSGERVLLFADLRNGS